MIQISHGRHVNVQEHRGVNRLTAQARCSPGLPAGDRGWNRGYAACSSPAPSHRAAHGWNSPELWLLEHMHSVPAWHHLPSPPQPFGTGHKERPALPAPLEYYLQHCSNFYPDFILPF